MSCGCSGNWKVRYFWVPGNQFLEYDQPGFEQDNPFTQVRNGALHLVSSCDNRSMELLTFTPSSVNTVTASWTPGSGCNPQSTPHDCINGKCELKTKHNTPGLYPSLSACEAVCGNGACVSGKQCLDPVNYCPAGKVCIENAEHTRIQSLINQIKSNFC
jgi:hypothetical protein